MAKYSQLDEIKRAAYLNHINQRWGQLYNLEKEYGDRAYKYLMLVNSGGAIAILSFMGASQIARDSCGVKLALVLFVCGVVLVGLSTAKQFYYLSGLFKNWKKDVTNFFNDQISWEHLLKEDEERAVENKLDHILPWLSFFCFIGGATTSFFSLL